VSTGLVDQNADSQVILIAEWIWSIAYFITLFFAIVVLLMERGDPAKTLSWIIVMLVIPILGMVLYNFFGASFKEEGKLKRIDEKSRELSSKYRTIIADAVPPLPDMGPQKLVLDIVYKNIRFLAHDPKSTLFKNTDYTLLIDGPDTFSAIKKDIRAARHHIHMEYFIWTDDKLGQEIKELLIEKVKEGVIVRILLDGVGCKSLSNAYINSLKSEGIEVEVFRPLWKAIVDSYSNFRNHRKIVVIDGHTGYTGGINVDGKYIEGDPDLGKWHDTHVKVEGDGAKGLQMTFLIDWFQQTKQEIVDPIYFPKTHVKNDQLSHIVPSGHQSEWDGIKQAYINSFYSADTYLYLITPYLSPNETLINGLKSAALTGVDTKLIVPRKGDSMITQSVTMSFAEDLLSCGVQIYQYSEGFIHSKIMVSDDQVATVGSANLDIRSMDQNLEINVFSYDPEFISDVKEMFLNDLKNSKQLDAAHFENYSFFKKVKLALFRLLSPLL
jgi:cardiolipin synthase